MARGEPRIAAAMAEPHARRARPRPPRPEDPLGALSEREREVLDAARRGPAQPRDRRAPGDQRGDRQDARAPRAREAALPQPRRGGGVRGAPPRLTRERAQPAARIRASGDLVGTSMPSTSATSPSEQPARRASATASRSSGSMPRTRGCGAPRTASADGARDRERSSDAGSAAAPAITCPVTSRGRRPEARRRERGAVDAGSTGSVRHHGADASTAPGARHRQDG